MPRRPFAEELALREEVLRRLRDGQTVYRIAKETGCSPTTVRNYRRALPSPVQSTSEPPLRPARVASVPSKHPFSPLEWVIFNGVKRQVLRVNPDGTLDLIALKRGKPLLGVPASQCAPL